MSKYIIIGKTYKMLHQRLETLGHEWTLVKHSTVNAGYSKKKPNTFYCDLSSAETIKAGVTELSDEINGVLNIYENFVLPSSRIATALGLHGITEESALLCSDKYLMREKFSKLERNISPDFDWADSWDQVESFAKNHGFPLILKPVGLSKSLMVSKNHDIAELRLNFDKIQTDGAKVYEKYSPGREPRFLVEEFMEGKIVSVDGFADSEGNATILDIVVDYESGYDVGMDDNFHYSRIIPSQSSEDVQAEIREVAAMGMKALKMTSSPAHCELILTEDGPKIVEIGARNGGYRARMHLLANDIDIYGAMLDLSEGKPLSVKPKRRDGCAVLELFPSAKGAYDRLENESELRALSSFNDLKITPKSGEIIGKSSDGYKMAARVVLFNENIEQFHKDLEYLKSKVSVITS